MACPIDIVSDAWHSFINLLRVLPLQNDDLYFFCHTNWPSAIIIFPENIDTVYNNSALVYK